MHTLLLEGRITDPQFAILHVLNFAVTTIQRWE
jgi:hypothetical protein